MLLGGFPGHLNVLESGDLLGEVGFFDGGVRTAGCTAIGPAVVFAFRHEMVHELLKGGHTFAWKVLRHLIHSVVGTMRVSTLRLREAIATERGEHEMAFRARDQALAAARAQELAVINAEISPGRVPLVLTTNPSGTAAASLTAVLRHLGRPVPLAVVSEAISEGGAVSDRSLEQGARSFGIALRRLVLTVEDTRGMDQPLLLDFGGRFAVAEGWSQGLMQVMDPSEGHLTLTARELEQRWNQQCFEVRGEQNRRQTLRERLLQWVELRRGAVLQLLGITALLQVAALGVPLATGAMIGLVLQQRVIGLVPVIGLGLIALVLGQTALTWLRARVLAFLRARLDLDLLDQLMAYVLRLPLEHFERHTASSLLQRFESFRVLRALLSSDGIAAALDLTMTSLSMVMLSFVNIRLAGVVLMAVLVHALLLRFFVPRLATFTVVQLEASAQQKHGLLEVLAGLVTLRLSGDPDNGARRWLPRLNRELDANSRLEGLSWWSQAMGELTQKLALTLLLWVGAAEVMAGHLSLAAMMVFLGVAASFFAALGVVAAEVLNLARSAPRLRQLGQTFDERPEQSIETTVQPGRLKGRISLDGVSFRYAPDSPLVLRDLQLTIEPGTKVALVGASGSGKSTLGKLLVGFYLPTAGRISFDRRDLASLELPALRSQLGVVLQDTFLFTGSIRENLSLCAPSAELSRLEDAAREASLDHVIDALPMRYDTVVSEGGSAFSGGQRQRLALARALVHSPAVLLLDEATSALDNVTQAAVEQNLARLSCTRIVIAHRLSTVIDADQIVVLEKGQIIETGRHHELLAKQGAYSRLINAQLGGEKSGQPRP